MKLKRLQKTDPHSNEFSTLVNSLRTERRKPPTKPVATKKSSTKKKTKTKKVLSQNELVKIAIDTMSNEEKQQMLLEILNET